MAQAIQRNTIEIDATGQAVGRLATEIAMILRGKTKATFAPHIDGGDFVKVINAGQVKFTGKKLVQKDYFHHTMYPGGIRRTPMKKVFDKNPGEVLKRAVYGMLPKNTLREDMIKRLTIEA
ncbi:MAG: 50S ribosomal protein L13 [Candidatus Magasanikbacteria bacterium CG10_big_fil_rev_8_21_14_0_10_43_6]|uniref:Large ribosomal subunit protein uL13 n=1 Tax=Candidatus Magasanikbacteria bacterium CG10_big_fil_rev_8_21_14_0_10_43_6 TaxID=1974650 RepID=A0A2M6W191_9BACT|nr:MAG: 50S ribosomal protein L13 [Candidatus Magasanikbacteria bacterium CG10_big_fil_rev_8_21_14_0_10_43_6]